MSRLFALLKNAGPALPRGTESRMTGKILSNHLLLSHQARSFTTASRPGSANESFELVYGDWRDPFVVINKRPGVHLYMGPEVRPSVERSAYQELLKRSIPRRVFFPHRIDNGTQGLIVLAFDRQTCAALTASLTQGLWHKMYRVLVDYPTCFRSDDTDHAVPSEPASATHTFEPFVQEKEHIRMRGEKAQGTYICKQRGGFLQGSLVLDGADSLSPDGTLYSWTGRLQPYLATLKEHAKRPDHPHFKRKQGPVPPPRHLAEPRCVDCPCDDLGPGARTVEGRDFSQVQYLNGGLRAWELEKSVQPWHLFMPAHMIHGSMPPERMYGGRESVTEYRLRQDYPELRRALYEVNLVTGRTHQIRVHFSEAGFPIAQDPLYNIPWICQHEEELRSLYQLPGHEREEDQRTDVNGFEQRLSDVLAHVTTPFGGLGLQAFQISFPRPTAGSSNKRKKQKASMGASEMEMVRVELPIPTTWPISAT